MDTKLQLVPDPRDDVRRRTAGSDHAGEAHAGTEHGGIEHCGVEHGGVEHGGAIPFTVPPRRARVRRLQGRHETRARQRLDGAPGRLAQLTDDERGAVTAEYAIVIMAAVAFAGLLVAILRSAEIRAMLVQLVEDALGAAG